MSNLQVDADRWRRKYRDTLFELEAKEREWRETETLLRLAVSRAALAAQGSNPRLNALLSELRAAVRGELNRSGLQRTLTKLREALYQSPDPEPEERSFDPAPFLRVLGKLPPALAASAQEAVPRLEAAGDVDTCLDVLVDLFRSGGEAQAYPQGQLEGLRDSLLELLDRLRLPEALDRRARALADELPGTRPDEVDEVLAGFADLLAQAHLELQEEKQALEGFLQQLIERLHGLERHLRNVTSVQRAAQEHRRGFDLRLDAEMRELGDSVRLADDLDALKTAVHERLDYIQREIELHRREARERELAAEREIQALSLRLEAMEAETLRLRQRLHRERRLALRDPLTALPNRLAYATQAAQEYARWRRYRHPLALLLWDVDGLKHINDTYGHKAGDRVLCIIARVLAAAVRETDFLARYEGGQFVVLMPETDAEGMRTAGERMRKMVEACNTHYRGEKVPLTISAGMTLFRDEDSVETALERARQALDQAKAAGRNRCVEA